MIAKLCMFLVSLTWLLNNKKVSQKVENKHILIFIERPGIGDVVLCLNALYNFISEIEKNNNFNITVAASSFICNFLKKVAPTLNLDFVEMQFELDKREDIGVFINNHWRLAEKHWDYIVSFDRMGGYLKGLLMGVSYDKLIYGEYKISGMGHSFDKIYDCFLKKKCCKYFGYSNNLMLHKALVNLALVNQALVSQALVSILGRDDLHEYKAYTIPILGESNLKSNYYCVISSGVAKGHDNQPRGWPLKRFRDVVDYILNNTDMDIVFCGSNDDLESNNELYKLVNNDRRVFNFTGKTNFAEWVEILRNAKFIFGNDSGYIHLASALGTQAFVIAGYWNYGRFLPYEKDSDDVIAPIDIRVERPKCALCNFMRHGCNDKKMCDNSVLNKNIYSCIDGITSDLAISKIAEWLEEMKYVK